MRSPKKTKKNIEGEYWISPEKKERNEEGVDPDRSMLFATKSMDELNEENPEEERWNRVNSEDNASPRRGLFASHQLAP